MTANLPAAALVLSPVEPHTRLHRCQWLFARHHRDGFALQVDVRFAADVDRDAVDRATGERVRRGARVIIGDGVAAVAPDAQTFAADRELARLGLDAALADLDVAVEERQRPNRDPRR